MTKKPKRMVLMVGYPTIFREPIIGNICRLRGTCIDISDGRLARFLDKKVRLIVEVVEKP